jgi:hypothetical protein
MMTSESQRSCLDNLQQGNSNTTIPVSQSHQFSYMSEEEFTGLTILMSGGRTTSCNLTL